MATKSTTSTSKKKAPAKKADGKSTSTAKAAKAPAKKAAAAAPVKAAKKTAPVEAAPKAEAKLPPQRKPGDGPIILADPDAKLTPAQLKQLYQTLITERARVIEGVKRHVGEAVEDQDRLPDDVDLASRHADQAFLLRFADKEHKLLRQINLALSKLETGEYGVCEGTGEPIGYARLKIRPWTRYSVQYKEELERRRAHEKR